MFTGEPVTDDDPWPWLTAIRTWFDEEGTPGPSTVMTCSPHVAMHGHRLSNQEVRASNDAWSAPDRARITAALNAVSDAVCVRPPSAGHTGIWTSDKRALVICLDYLLWPGSRVPKDLPPALFPNMKTDERDAWYELSTFWPHDGGPTNEEQAPAICLACSMALPRTGSCDACD